MAEKLDLWGEPEGQISIAGIKQGPNFNKKSSETKENPVTTFFNELSFAISHGTGNYSDDSPGEYRLTFPLPKSAKDKHVDIARLLILGQKAQDEGGVVFDRGVGDNEYSLMPNIHREMDEDSFHFILNQLPNSTRAILKKEMYEHDRKNKHHGYKDGPIACVFDKEKNEIIFLNETAAYGPILDELI